MTEQNDHDLLITLNAKIDVILTDMQKFVTKQEFAPVKAVVYGLISIVLVGAGTALCHMIIKG